LVKIRKDAWKSEEDEILRNLYQYASKNTIMSLLPNRTWGAIRRRAKQLGLFRGYYTPPLDILPQLDINEATRVWLACAIDCEGNISLVKRKRTDLVNGFNLLPQIGLSNTNKEFIETFINKTFPNIVRLKVLKRFEKSGGKHKDKYYVQIFRMPLVYSLLKEIRPYLIIKRQQADLVMEFIELEDMRLRNRVKYGQSYLSRQLEIFEEVRKLNG